MFLEEVSILELCKQMIITQIQMSLSGHKLRVYMYNRSDHSSHYCVSIAEFRALCYSTVRVDSPTPSTLYTYSRKPRTHQGRPPQERKHCTFSIEEVK